MQDKIVSYLPLVLTVIAITLISVGVFLWSLSIGFIVTGFLVALLAYLVTPKGDEP